MDEFEQRLARQELKQAPVDWRGDVLANARRFSDERVAVATSETDTASLLDTLRTLLHPKRILWVSLTSAWVAIIGLNFSARVEDDLSTKSPVRADAETVVEGVQRYHTRLAALLLEGETIDVPEEMDRSDTTGPRSDATRQRRNAQFKNRFYA